MPYYVAGGLAVKIVPGRAHNANTLCVDLRIYEIENRQQVPKKGLQIPYRSWVDILETNWENVLKAFQESSLRPSTWEYPLEPCVSSGAHQKIIASVQECGNHAHLDLRVWVREQSGGEYIPTQSGARLDHPSALKLREIHDTKLKVDQAFARDNKIVGHDFTYE